MSGDHDKHHILSDKISLTVLIGLLVLTVITVVASRIDFGDFNFVIAMAIASIKALMVMLFFMGLKYDENENQAFFFSSFLFLAIFIFFTAFDIYTRPANWRNAGSHLKEVAQSGVSKFKKPWVGSPELIAHGKEVFQAQCVVCHGADGHGDGPASGALNPKPRNFHEEQGWKNGRKISDVFGTLKNGLNSMPSFATLSQDDRWSVAHYILSLGPTPPVASADDLKKVGIVDVTKDDGGMGGAEAAHKKIPVEFAIDRYLQSQRK
jgi:caa(3)-type oxidase subunit IV